MILTFLLAIVWYYLLSLAMSATLAEFVVINSLKQYFKLVLKEPSLAIMNGILIIISFIIGNWCLLISGIKK